MSEIELKQLNIDVGRKVYEMQQNQNEYQNSNQAQYLEQPYKKDSIQLNDAENKRFDQLIGSVYLKFTDDYFGSLIDSIRNETSLNILDYRNIYLCKKKLKKESQIKNNFKIVDYSEKVEKLIHQFLADYLIELRNISKILTDL